MIPHLDRLQEIWKRLWVLIKIDSPEARAEEEKLLAEMDELDPSGTAILEHLREQETEEVLADDVFLEELKAGEP